ncbi:uncharacterized protein N7511_001511 [Penicillium nucicola]|uniref:uncharacterized protein n=1 Tax=Penicillium nucicola TaxID=1850975 RepID=UPI002544E656|nr:uncharacterized protein N7511_001511 [Penicillium nucicola]KAJ5776500.1 hypothetical protein N7511_001511 [Penicillium nucicola]
MTNALSVAELAIYIALAFPTVYLIIKHGRQGLLGWLFLFIFCTLRIIGNALAIKPSSPTASIIASVGLSPLLLGASGILHEARIYRILGLNQKLEWALALLYHIFVVGGVALTAAGSAKLQKHQQPVETADGIVKAGIAILTICWAALVGGIVFSFITPARTSAVGRAGTTLLTTLAFALVWIGIRVFYSLVYLCTQKQYLNPTTGSLAIRLILGFLAELIAAISLIVAGVVTQDASRNFREDGELPSTRKSTSPVSVVQN